MTSMTNDRLVIVLIYLGVIVLLGIVVYFSRVRR